MLQFLYGSLDDAAVTQLLTTIDEELSRNAQLAGFSLLVHSNNGAFVYGELKRRMNEPGGRWAHLAPKLRGVVFDSAPGLFAPDGRNGATSLADALQSESKDSALRAALRSVVACFHFSFPCVAIVTNRPVYVHWFWTLAITL